MTTREAKGRLRCLGVTLATVLGSASAAASPLFELTGAIGGTGGLNARVTGPSAASTYFNPALLANAQEELDVGFVMLSDQIELTLDGRTGGIVPLSVGDRQFFTPGGAPISNATVPTDWLQNGCRTAACQPPFAARPRQADGTGTRTHTYTALGLVNRILDDKLVLGLYALVPNGDFTTARSFYVDEREQFFSNSLHPELYSDRLTATSLAFGAGSRVLKQLSVGLSFTLNFKNVATANTYVRDSVDYGKIFLTNDVHVRTSVSPHFGLLYTPLDWLDLSATVHTKQQMEIDTTVSAALPAGQESGTSRTAVHDFLPWTFGLGATARAVRRPTFDVDLVASVTYALWSGYIDRQGERPSDEGSRYDFSNVLTPAAGVRFSSGHFRGFFDANYQPSPVPPQTGRRNYVDNDRLGFSLGADYTFAVSKVKLRPGVQFGTFVFPRRYQKKDDAQIIDEVPDDAVDASGNRVAGAGGLQTNNPGWPGFASQGFVFDGAVTLALVY